MNFYRLIDDSGREANGVLVYHETQADAHSDAKSYSKHRWPDLRIELVDVPTDKESIRIMLNNDSKDYTVQRTWAITPRGGMTEVPNGE